MNRIKNLREEFGYTQQDLANKLECSKSVIGLYENETRKPSMEVLVKLSEIFNCTIDYLLCKSEYRNEDEHIKAMLKKYDKLIEENGLPAGYVVSPLDDDATLLLEEIKQVQFANSGGLDTEGLDNDDLEELQRQIDYIKKMKNKKEK